MNKVILGFAMFSLMTTLLYILFPVVRVCGNSMYPTLKDGEIYIGRRVFRKTKCKANEIYVFKPPYESDEERFVIKRLISIKDGKYFFTGDNANESYDSRSYDYVNSSNIVAHIVLKKGRRVQNERV